MMGKWAWLRLYLNWPLAIGIYGAAVGFAMVAQHPLTAQPSQDDMELLRHGAGLGFALACSAVAGVGGGQKVAEILERRKAAKAVAS